MEVVGIGAVGASNLLDLVLVLVDVVAPSLPNMVLPFFLSRNNVGVWSEMKLFLDETLNMTELALDGLRGRCCIVGGDTMEQDVSDD